MLYIDGEMSRRDLRRRLRDAVKREGAADYLATLSKEYYPDLPPLNTKDGQDGSTPSSKTMVRSTSSSSTTFKLCSLAI